MKTPLSGRKSRIMVVDDHPLMREGIAMAINQHEDLEICGIASDCRQAIHLLQTGKPDAAVIDLSLQESSGFEVIKELKALRPGLPIVVLSMHEETVFAERALQAGASGYIMKTDGSRRLVEGVQQVLAGNMFFSDDMRSRLLGRAVAGSNAAVGMDALTDRELDVFDMLGRGLSSREVAARLKLSTHTIAFYRDRLKTKLGMRSSAELLRKATAWVQSGGGDTLSGSGTRHAAAAPHGELTPPSTGV